MLRLKEIITSHVPLLVGWLLLATSLVALWAGSARALGTSAGTPIINTATVSYTLGADPTPRTSTATNRFNVMEVIDVVVTWQDAANITVNSPQADTILTFLITNTGNGPEDIELLTNETLVGDLFDPSVQEIFLESNGILGWQSEDTLYADDNIAFAADEAMTVYVRCNIPSGQANTHTGNLQLTAQSTTAGAPGSSVGTLLLNLGFGGVDAIVGTSRADGDAIGTYEVSAAMVDLTKSVVQIVDPYGGNQPYTSARVTYRIVVDVTGFGIAEALTITDAIPSNTTYVADSLELDGTTLTDDMDGDSGDFNLTTTNAVTVNLGDTVAPATHTIEFETTIN